MKQIKKVAPYQENDLFQNNSVHSISSKPNGKLVSMLSHFANGESLNRYEAERIADHCLPTTISDLQIKHRIEFSRKREKIPNRFGGLTSVCRYWLEGDQLEKARFILGQEEIWLKLTWLVIDDHKGPLALVQVNGKKVKVIAGDSRAISGFKKGQPNLAVSSPWCFEPISGRLGFPAIGEWLNTLGPAKDATYRLREEKRKEKATANAKAKRERAENLHKNEISEIRAMISRGVKAGHIAEKFGVSASFIRRQKGAEVLPIYPPVHEASKGTEYVDYRGGNFCFHGEGNMSELDHLENVAHFPNNQTVLAPLVPDGEYTLKLEGYETKYLFGKSPRFIMTFSIVDFGEYFGIKIQRFYSPLKLTGKPGKNHNCEHRPTGSFMQDFYRLFPDQPRRNPSRMPIEPFKDVEIVGKVVTVKQNSLQEVLPEQLWHSKIEKLLRVER